MFKTSLVKLLRWYMKKVSISWSRELTNLRQEQDAPIWFLLCIGFTVFLFVYLLPKAFSLSILTGLSFTWATFVAISFAYVLRSPLLLVLVYVGVIFSREIMGIFIAAKNAALVGDILGALILIVLGIYLTTKANDMKSGAILLDSTVRNQVRKASRRKPGRRYKRKR